MNELSKVRGWLKNLEVEDSEDEATKVLGQNSTPATPPRRPQTYQQVVEISPTDTSFSGNSIFDAPARYRHEPESPCPQRRYREHESLNSYDPLSEDEFDVPPSLSAPRLLLPQDPNLPRIVKILSCLQCTSTGLFCSRTIPSCSRCIRNNTPETCLLLRQRFYHEINHADDKDCTRPVLLKLQNEDANAWQNKLAVAEEIKQAWEEKQNRLNWVLPRVDSEVRGSWRVDGRVGSTRKWPSEGTGRMVFEELVVKDEGVVV